MSNSTVQPGSSSSFSSKYSSGLSHSAVIGVVVGCTAAIVLGAGGGTFMVKQRSRRTKPIDFPNELESSSPALPLGELSVERQEQEILSSNTDRAELPSTSRRYSIENSTNHPIIPDTSTGNYRSRAWYRGNMGSCTSVDSFLVSDQDICEGELASFLFSFVVTWIEDSADSCHLFISCREKLPFSMFFWSLRAEQLVDLRCLSTSHLSLSHDDYSVEPWLLLFLWTGWLNAEAHYSTLDRARIKNPIWHWYFLFKGFGV